MAVTGLAEAKAAFQALPQITKDRMLDAGEVTVREIARGAQARLAASPSIITRNLYNHVGWSVSKSTGRAKVGISSGSTTLTRVSDRKKVRVKGVVISKGNRSYIDIPAKRAHFVEFGTRKMRAEPFMIPAAESQVQPYLDRCRAAGQEIERETASIGMRNL